MLAKKDPKERQLDLERAKGALLGLAAGDRIGGPTAMALCLAESLASEKAFSPARVLQTYWAWWRKDGRDSGPTVTSVFRSMDAGIGNPQAVLQAHMQAGGRSAGCNPLHRCPPLALASFVPDDLLMEMVHEDASLTHHDPLAGHVAAAGALVLRGLIKGLDWLETIAWARMSDGPELARWLQPPDNPAQPDGFAPNVLRAAVYFVGRSGSLDEALRNSMAFAGPATTHRSSSGPLAVLVGGFPRNQAISCCQGICETRWRAWPPP